MTMYKLTLLAAALLVGTMGVASAQSLPPEFRGVWCGSSNEGQYFRPRGRECPGSSGDNIMDVTADGYTIEEGRCKATSIVSSPDRRRPAIKFSCTGADGSAHHEEWRLVEKKLWRKRIDEESTTSARPAAPVEYECAGYRSVPSEAVERDPVVKTSVTVTPFRVKHTSLAGEIYAREEQYRDVRTWSNRNGDYWSGISVNNPRRTMVGQLAYDDRRGVSARLYVEKSFIDGRLERTTTSTCVWASE
jgi:hypothetical protein